MKAIIITFVLFILNCMIKASNVYYIQSAASCGTSCDGSKTNPFDSLFIALAATWNVPDSTLLLLKD